MTIYLTGSLRNPRVPQVAGELRQAGYNVFDDWFAAGPEADDRWRDYEKGKAHTLREALHGAAATNVFDFDKRNLDGADIVVLLMPAGKSAFLELGYAIGRGKKGYILLDGEPDRYDVMFKFAHDVATSTQQLITMLGGDRGITDRGQGTQTNTPVDGGYALLPGCLGGSGQGLAGGERPAQPRRAFTLGPGQVDGPDEHRCPTYAGPRFGNYD